MGNLLHPGGQDAQFPLPQHALSHMIKDGLRVQDETLGMKFREGSRTDQDDYGDLLLQLPDAGFHPGKDIVISHLDFGPISEAGHQEIPFNILL